MGSLSLTCAMKSEVLKGNIFGAGLIFATASSPEISNLGYFRMARFQTCLVSLEFTQKRYRFRREALSVNNTVADNLVPLLTSGSVHKLRSAKGIGEGGD